MIKVIKNDSDLETALEKVEELIDNNPEDGSQDADTIELLTALIQNYETEKYTIDLPDPVEAIKFRMEQQNLSQSDLIPFIGSRSKVSEVLSRKRPLSLSMIRSLHGGLGIPANVLLEKNDPATMIELDIEWDKFPLKEMIKRLWISDDIVNKYKEAEDILRQYLAPIGPPAMISALARKTKSIRSYRSMDEYALTAWSARIILRTINNPPPVVYNSGAVNLEAMREIVKLSWYEDGPLLAMEYLSKIGIALVIEPHLPKTYLDGAAMKIDNDQPIIGLTLRYDRIDNFWFCLMHELAHVALHLDKYDSHYYDDLEVEYDLDPRESKADELALEALIPIEVWDNSPASRLRTPEAAQDLAKDLKIHPAIVAGRIRHTYRSYRVLNQLVGHGKIRSLFIN